jgi:hypothetical protein
MKSLSIWPLLAAAGAVCAASAAMRPGMWETTMSGEMTGGQPVVSRACVSQKQIDESRGLPKMDGEGMRCEQLDVKASGNSVTWRLRCTGEVPVEGTGQMTSTGESYSGRIDLTARVQGQTMRMNQTITGRRVGDCR